MLTLYVGQYSIVASCYVCMCFFDVDLIVGPDNSVTIFRYFVVVVNMHVCRRS